MMNQPHPTVEQFLGTPYTPEEDEEHNYVDVVMTRPPGHDSDFVELEDSNGRSLGPSSGADWVDRGDGYAVLRIPQIAPDPMDRIATALEALAEPRTRRNVSENFTAELVSSGDGHNPEACPVEQECADLEAKLQTATQVIADVDAALGKSTAKPALAAKAVIEAWRNPPVEASEGEGWCDVCRAFHPEGAGCIEEAVGEAVGEVLMTGKADGGGATVDFTQLAQPEHGAPVEVWREYARGLGYAGPDIDKANRSQIRTALGITQTPAEGGA